jgi:hypothetical protein
MRTHVSLLIPTTLILALSGCGSSHVPVPPPGEPMNPPTEDPGLAEMLGEPSPPAKSTASAAAVTEPPAPAMPPASKHTIAGVSISDIDEASLVKAIEKAGWKADGAASTAGKLYETVRVGIAADKNKGSVEITRRVKTAGTSENPTTQEMQATRTKDGAAVMHDATADAVVTLSWTGKDAKKLLEKLVTKK